MDTSRKFRMDSEAKMKVAIALTKIWSDKVNGWKIDIPENEVEPLDIYYTAITKHNIVHTAAIEVKSRPEYNKDSFGGENEEGWMIEDKKEKHLKEAKEKGYKKGLYIFITNDDYVRIFDIDTWKTEYTSPKRINYYTVEPEKGSRVVRNRGVKNSSCIWEGYV